MVAPVDLEALSEASTTSVADDSADPAAAEAVLRNAREQTTAAEKALLDSKVWTCAFVRPFCTFDRRIIAIAKPNNAALPLPRPHYSPNTHPPDVGVQRENESLSSRLQTLSVELEKEKKKTKVANHPAADAVEQASTAPFAAPPKWRVG